VVTSFIDKIDIAITPGVHAGRKVLNLVPARPPQISSDARFTLVPGNSIARLARLVFLALREYASFAALSKPFAKFTQIICFEQARRREIVRHCDRRAFALAPAAYASTPRRLP
jgi:hypothetical protein